MNTYFYSLFSLLHMYYYNGGYRLKTNYFHVTQNILFCCESDAQLVFTMGSELFN